MNDDATKSVKKINSLCLIGLILSFGAYISPFFNNFMSIVAFVLCIMGLIELKKKQNERGRYMAIIGIILASIGPVLLLAQLITIIIFHHSLF